MYFNKLMEDITIIDYVKAAFFLQQLTDPDLVELKKILVNEIILELTEPDCMCINDRVEQIIEIGREYDLHQLETFIKQQNILPLFVQDETGYYRITNELDNAITIFFKQ